MNQQVECARCQRKIQISQGKRVTYEELLPFMGARRANEPKETDLPMVCAECYQHIKDNTN